MNQRLPYEKGFHVSWEQLHRDSRALAWRLGGGDIDPANGTAAEAADGAAAAGGPTWRAVVAIARGGMVPACVVARELNVRAVDTISVRSYDHQTQGEAEVLKRPDPSVVGDGTGVLVIDDLADTGRTLRVIKRLLPKAHYATVYAKPQGAPEVHTFVTTVSQDTWIFFPWDMALMYVDPFKGTR
ncbi:MAG: xanthine phosphoribosyltransferase [Pseudomonadota bacterium]